MNEGRYSRDNSQEFQSLSPAVFNILLVLSDGEDSHGYGIAREVESRTGVKLGPGTLYGAIKRMISQGLIVEAGKRKEAEQHSSGHEERRRYYRITGAGLQAASVEAQRLDSLVSSARDRGLLPRPEPIPGEV